MPSIGGFAVSNYDDSTIGINASNQLEVKDNGVGMDQLAGGTPDYLLGFDGSGDPTEIAKSAAGGWVVVAESTIAGADVQEVEWTGLDIDTDKVYKLFAIIENNFGNVVQYRLQVNGDTTDGNYNTRQIMVGGGGVTSALPGNPIFAEAGAGAYVQTDTEFTIMRGRGTGWAKWNYKGYFTTATPATFNQISFGKRQVDANITSLKIRCNQANGIKIGSYFLLVKCRG